jgi:CheY-like chemotaxis protein
MVLRALAVHFKDLSGFNSSRPQSRQMARQETIRILCVEDDDTIRLNAVEALKDAGFDVLEAQDGDRAMALTMGPDAVDVVFTDVAMPDKWVGWI